MVAVHSISISKDKLQYWSYNNLSTIIERINNIVLPDTNKPSETSVSQIATEVTVQIWSDDQFIGSGTIISKNDHRYEIITNSHVLRSGTNDSYVIQTHDDTFYDAQVIAYNSQKNFCWDLAVLSFQSPQKNYKTTTVAPVNSYGMGDSVFVAGFVIDNDQQELETNKKSNHAKSNKFLFTTGKVYSILDQSLMSGYQIGFTNMLKKGMSGGPLLNQSGELIGINGRHAYPLWESADFYKDGTQASEEVQQVIDSHSWAISIETVLQFYQEIQNSSINTSKEIESSTSAIQKSTTPEDQLDLCR